MAKHETCTKRIEMPQVKLEAYPSLFAFLNMRGVTVSEHILPVYMLRTKQCKDHLRPTRRLELVRTKPMLVSLDMYVLDGNHRWARFMQDDPKQHVKFFRTSCSFKEACGHLFAFPETYTTEFIPA
jgi:hypothetical protein